MVAELFFGKAPTRRIPELSGDIRRKFFFRIISKNRLKTAMNLLSF
jgi:hypothetical protein